jgi:hypothetical protein
MALKRPDGTPYAVYPAFFVSAGVSRKNLGFTNSEHFGATGWTRTLGSGSLILHSDSLGILHFLLGLTFHTVCLHVFTSFLLRTIDYSLYHVNGKRYLTQRSHSLVMLPITKISGWPLWWTRLHLPNKFSETPPLITGLGDQFVNMSIRYGDFSNNRRPIILFQGY